MISCTYIKYYIYSIEKTIDLDEKRLIFTPFDDSSMLGGAVQ